MINNMTQHHYHMRYMNYLKYGLYSPPSEEGHDKESSYPPVFSNFEDANRFLKDFWKNKTSMKNRNSYAKLAEEIEEYLTIQLYGNKSFNK